MDFYSGMNKAQRNTLVGARTNNHINGAIYSVYTKDVRVDAERLHYDVLPKMAILELPQHVVNQMMAQTAEHGENAFEMGDLIDTWLLCCQQTEEADVRLENWFEELAGEPCCDPKLPGVPSYLLAMTDMAFALKQQLYGLHTPTGNQYYQFLDWMDSHTLILGKREYGA